MRKHISLAIAFLILFTPLVIGVQFPDAYKMVSRATGKAIYAVKYTDALDLKWKESSYASCVFIEKNYCITNAHLVRSKPVGEIFIQIQNGDKPELLRATVDYWDGVIDLMVLKTEKDVPFEPVNLAKDYTVGKDIMFGGYGKFIFPKIRFGKLNYHSHYGIYVDDMYFGDSGSGVFNMKGELLGIIYTIFNLKDNGQQTFRGYAIPLETLRDFLLKWRNKTQGKSETK